ncbi:MAG: hypothetical protein AAFX10_02620 [Pseudomonadota bacterium]
MTAPKLSVRRVDPDVERAAIQRLLTEHLPDGAADSRFEAMYLANPRGKALVWLAETPEGKAVGTSAAFPRLFHVSGRELVGLVLSDFAIDSAFRTLGPAISLLKATLGPVENDEYAFALDFPSESMLAVYKRLKWTELDRVSRFVRPLRLSPAIGRRYGSIAATVVGRPLDGLLAVRDAAEARSAGYSASARSMDSVGAADVADTIRKGSAVFGDRGHQYLAWRYQDGLRFSYTLLVLESDDEQLGYAVLQHGGAGPVTIVEFESPDEVAVRSALMAAVARWSRRRGADGVQASALPGTAWHSMLAAAGFKAREESTGPVVYSKKDAPWCDLITDSGSWWMTDGDRDG